MVSRCSAQPERGFTLIELIIAVVILGILISVAAPAFNETIAVQRLRASANELRASIGLARSEAVKRNVATGLTLARRDGDWSNGWCVLNPDSTATACMDTSDGTSYDPGNYLSEVVLTDGVAVSATGGETNLSFNNWGRTAGCPRFEFSATAGSSTCRMCLSSTLDGRVVVASGACSGSCPTGAEDVSAWADACP